MCCEHADIRTQGNVFAYKDGFGLRGTKRHRYYCPTCRDRLGITARHPHKAEPCEEEGKALPLPSSSKKKQVERMSLRMAYFASDRKVRSKHNHPAPPSVDKPASVKSWCRHFCRDDSSQFECCYCRTLHKTTKPGRKALTAAPMCDCCEVRAKDQDNTCKSGSLRTRMSLYGGSHGGPLRKTPGRASKKNTRPALVCDFEEEVVDGYAPDDTISDSSDTVEWEDGVTGGLTTGSGPTSAAVPQQSRAFWPTTPPTIAELPVVTKDEAEWPQLQTTTLQGAPTKQEELDEIPVSDSAGSVCDSSHNDDWDVLSSAGSIWTVDTFASAPSFREALLQVKRTPDDFEILPEVSKVRAVLHNGFVHLNQIDENEAIQTKMHHSATLKKDALKKDEDETLPECDSHPDLFEDLRDQYKGTRGGKCSLRYNRENKGKGYGRYYSGYYSPTHEKRSIKRSCQRLP